MNKHVQDFKTFEGDTYAQFLQQAQVAQSGNPYWFGRNPKTSQKAKKGSKLVKTKKS